MSNFEQVTLLMTVMIEDQCFRRWVSGNGRMGNTFKEHCLAYFQPNITATNFINSAQRELNTSDTPFEVYLAVLKAEREIFEKYSNEEAANVLKLWQESQNDG